MAFFIFTSHFVVGQRCHYEIDEVDAFTQLSIKRTTAEVICRLNNYPVDIKAQCIGDSKYLKLRYYKYNDFVFQEDEPIIFVLSNGDEITLAPRSMPTRSFDGSIEDVSALLVYKLDEQQIEKLLSLAIVKFKYPVTTGYMEKEIKGKKQLHISNLLKCVM